MLNGPVVVSGYFLWGWDTPNPPKKQKKSHFIEFDTVPVQGSSIFFPKNNEIDTGAAPIFF